MSDKARKIAQVLCVMVLVIALCGLGFIGYTYLKSSAFYDELRQYKIEQPSSTTAPSKQEESLATLSVDWDALRSKNTDTVAWITLEGTNIDYPVVQAADNDFYLHQGFDGSWSANGAIFLDAADPANFSARNCLVYGHHMRDGSMFASLASLANQRAFDKCDTAYILTPEKNMLLKPIALVDVSGNDEQIQIRPSSAKEEAVWVRDVLSRATCKAKGADPSKIEQTVCLVTCDELGSDGRYVLVCSVELSVPVG